MALHFSLEVNHNQIGWFVAQRLEEVPEDGISRYQIDVDGHSFEMKHRYDDGAWELVRKALEEVHARTR